MIDKDARSKLRMTLKSGAIGRISATECENQVLDIDSLDPVAKAFAATVKELVDDWNDSLESVFRRGSSMRRNLARWLIFLEHAYEYEWPASKLPVGVLNYYRPTKNRLLRWFSGSIEREIKDFKSFGDYEVWPFVSVESLDIAREPLNCVGLKASRMTP